MRRVAPLVAVSLVMALNGGNYCLAAQPITVDAELLLQMQQTIQHQQEQLRQQADQLKSQSETLRQLQQQITALQQSTPAPATAPPSPSARPSEATISKTSPALAISSGNDKIKLAISGQINRAVNTINDGRSTQLYHVDNGASNSRIRVTSTARISDDLTLGTRIEVAVAPDTSSRVSQSEQSPGDYFNQRWTEISLTSATYGKLSLGKGDTASNTTAEADLSKTDVVQYSSVADSSGGMLFRERNGDQALTSLKISDAFKSGDGLSRQSRLRYDTPTRYGFRLAGSLVTNQQSDIALFWRGEWYGFKGSGAFAVANPKQTGAGLLYDGSFSLLHTMSGLNLTISGALLDTVRPKDRTNLYAKLGWLTNFTSLGYTAFGLDYTRSEQVAAEGDKGYSVGAAAVQYFEKVATELYLQYRIYSLNRAANTPPVADMHVGTFGARIKF